MHADSVFNSPVWFCIGAIYKACSLKNKFFPAFLILCFSFFALFAVYIKVSFCQ